MLKETKNISIHEIKLEATRRFGIDPDTLVELEGFENFVYVCEADGEQRILRLTHNLHRPKQHIRGEVAWINDMASRDIPVASALRSQKGEFTEIIPHDPSGTHFTATMFEFAPGVLLDDDYEAKNIYWNTALFEQWGKVMANIHDHAQHHAPRLGIQRPQWHEYDVLDLEKFIPRDQTQLLKNAGTHLEKLHNLPRSSEVYGLTHADLTQWNFNVEGGQITVYDFDSSEYGWFVKDLAVSLYYAGASYEGENVEAFNQKFFEHLVRGYRRVRPISVDWLERIPDFLFLQRIILYSFCYQILDMKNLTEDDRAFLEKTRTLIETGEEPIIMDYGSLSQ